MKSGFSLQFSAILVRLNHNKTLLVAIGFILISSCSFFTAKPKPEGYHVEVLCQNLGIKVLIHNTKSADFWEALEKFHNEKQERGSSEDYTVLIFKNNNSMHFKGVKPEDMVKQCVARDVLWSHVNSSYVIY